MIQKDKELLLKYLCMALPYNVVIEYNDDGYSLTRELGLGSLHDFMFDNAECKPYLRPMSSMTEEELDTYRTLKWTKLEHEVVDWLNAHHFDYCGLIDKGLALEAPEDMYK